MSIESVIQVVITAEGGGVNQKGFGIPAVVGYHTQWGQRAKVYETASVLTDLTNEGITSIHPIYREVASVVSQNPSVPTIVVGRMTGTWTQAGTLEPVGTPAEGDVYAFTLRNPAGVTTDISYTVQAGDVIGDVATAINTQITAVADITSSVTVSPTIDWDADNALEFWTFEGLDEKQFAFQDQTVAPTDTTIATDLAAIREANDDWYGLASALPRSKAIILELEAQIETMEKVGGFTYHDSDNKDAPDTASIMYAANAAQYFRSWIAYSADQTRSLAAGQIGENFPYDPGSSNYAYKTIAGVTVDNISATGQTNMKNKKGTYYVRFGGKPATFNGEVASGEWLDVVIGRDYIVARIREYVANLLLSSRKIPYTDAGVEQIKKEIRAVLRSATSIGILSAEEPFTVTAPKVVDISSTDKANRFLPDVRFTATLAGAIHSMKITGVLQV